MNDQQQSNHAANAQQPIDALVVGTGFSGLYMIHRLRKAGLTVCAVERGDDVGGTWYWNTYPGARCDSDAMVYCYSDRMDPDMIHEWTWSERYPTRREIHRYLQWVADRMGLRDAIRFRTAVTSAQYDETRQHWNITTDSGERIVARYFIPAVGALSKPNIPDFAGLESFRGRWFHTARMPKQGVDWAGKRVAVIGSGATAVQIVPEIAREAAQVYEFVRSPAHIIPGRNQRLDRDDWQEIQTHYEEIWARSREHFGGFPYADTPRKSSVDSSDSGLKQLFDRVWQQGGLSFLYGFPGLLKDRDMNDRVAALFNQKIRERVHDPHTAAAITPTGPVGTMRTPVEHGYYTALNRDNVAVVDLNKEPIVSMTAHGIRTRAAQYDVDIIVLATGFDAYTGSLYDMDIRGRDGLRLADKWAEAPDTYLGITVNGFPNMFMVYCGPGSPSVFVNCTALVEQQGDWIADCLTYMDRHGHTAIEARRGAEEQFCQIHQDIADATLVPHTHSWWTGSNTANPDKPRTTYVFVGGLPRYRHLCDQAGGDYQGFAFQ